MSEALLPFSSALVAAVITGSIAAIHYGYTDGLELQTSLEDGTKVNIVLSSEPHKWSQGQSLWRRGGRAVVVDWYLERIDNVRNRWAMVVNGQASPLQDKEYLELFEGGKGHRILTVVQDKIEMELEMDTVTDDVRQREKTSSADYTLEYVVDTSIKATFTSTRDDGTKALPSVKYIRANFVFSNSISSAGEDRSDRQSAAERSVTDVSVARSLWNTVMYKLHLGSRHTEETSVNQMRSERRSAENAGTQGNVTSSGTTRQSAPSIGTQMLYSGMGVGI